MTSEIVLWILAAWWATGLALHVATATAAAVHPIRRRKCGPAATVPVSVLFGMKGIEPEQSGNLSSVLTQDYPHYETIVALASATDPARDVARRVLALPGTANAARMVVADPAAHPHPKTATFLPAIAAATHDVVLMCDGNVACPPRTLKACVPALGPGVGLVSIVAVGVRPTGLAAEIECAFLNGYGARWLMAADMAGVDVAFGKAMLARRSDLDRAGGLGAIAQGMAEDAAMGQALARLGLRALCAPVTVEHPVGARTLGAVISRHFRWLCCRRAYAPAGFAGEAATGLAATAAAGAAWGVWGPAGAALPMVAITVAVWLATEAALTLVRDWHLSWRAPIAWLAREALLPVLWARAAVARSVEWQGTRIAVSRRAALPQPARAP